jgi:hypothetical protein
MTATTVTSAGTATRPFATATASPAPTSARPSSSRRLIGTTALATLAAAVATEMFVALVGAAGPDVTIDGKALGAGGCAMAVIMCMVPAAIVIAALRRWSSNPARTWIRTTVALTVLSFGPDLAVPSTPVASRLTLMAAHLLAAAIIVPAVARRLR